VEVNHTLSTEPVNSCRKVKNNHSVRAATLSNKRGWYIQRKCKHEYGDYGMRGVLSVSLFHPTTEDLHTGQEGVVCNHSSRQLQWRTRSFSNGKVTQYWFKL